MKGELLCATASALFVAVSGHGNMIQPRPRSSHNQVLDARNQCGCESTPGGCFQNASSPGYYCGGGCIGEACLFYQIGCFQSCGTCSYTGKTLYPVAADLVAAGCSVPPAPTLGGGDAAAEHALRTYNIDNASHVGDWTKWNPWRSPGTAGKGNPAFSPCGINSGSKPPFPDPPSTHAGDPPSGADGRLLPPLPKGSQSTWKAGTVVEASWSIYANHGGGYSYRLCKMTPGGEPTEACFQGTPLDFASDFTTIKYTLDPSKKDVVINATTTNAGTFPEGSMWRKNPIPMCNCDIGEGCSSNAEVEPEVAVHERMSLHAFEMLIGGKGKGQCKAVIREQCGDDVLVNTCLKCGDDPSLVYDCEECCPGLTLSTKGGYKYCSSSKPQQCDPASGLTSGCVSIPYPKTYVPAGWSGTRCPSGLMFPASFPEGYGGDGTPWNSMGIEMVDQLKLPSTLAAGEYQISFRWDCEQTPQVWNSCADVTITAA